jgi:hypothetical protein
LGLHTTRREERKRKKDLYKEYQKKIKGPVTPMLASHSKEVRNISKKKKKKPNPIQSIA